MSLVARVFPRRTSWTPIDEHTYFDGPPLFPKYDEAHISVTFTWDKPIAEHLAKKWGKIARIGGPAYDDPGKDFAPGMYVKNGIVFTSRGCPNICGFCFVPKREGKIRELPIVDGNNIADNNFLACSLEHKNKVMDMLKKQKAVIFSGGIDPELVDDWFVERLKEIRLKKIYLAYDYKESEDDLIKAVNKLNRYNREKLFCYVLIGWNKNGTGTMEESEVRLKRTWDVGVMPFAMLYRDINNTPYSSEWKKFQKQWVRPAIIKAKMRNK